MFKSNCKYNDLLKILNDNYKDILSDKSERSSKRNSERLSSMNLKAVPPPYSNTTPISFPRRFSNNNNSESIKENNEKRKLNLDNKYIKCNWLRECEDFGFIKNDKGLFLKSKKYTTNSEIPCNDDNINDYIENVKICKEMRKKEFKYKCIRREFIGIIINNLVDISIDYLTCISIICGICDYIDNSNYYNCNNIKFHEFCSIFISKILPLISMLLENNNEKYYFDYNIMNMSLNGLNNNKENEYSDKIYKLIIKKFRVLYEILLDNEIVLFSYTFDINEKGIRV